MLGKTYKYKQMEIPDRVVRLNQKSGSGQSAFGQRVIFPRSVVNKWRAMEQVIGKRGWKCEDQPPQMCTSALTLPGPIHCSANQTGNRATGHTSDNVQTTKEPKDVFAGNRDSEKQLRNLRRHAKQFRQKMLP